MGSQTAPERQVHAVCMPYPAQGHVTPMLKLAKLLHARGFHITFVNTEYNHRRLLRSRGAASLASVPGFHFTSIPDGLPPSDADATQDIPALCYSTMTTCLPHLRSLLASLNSDTTSSPPVTCLVVDAVMSFGYEAAREIGIPVAALWTASACGFMGYRNYRYLIDRAIVPFTSAADLADVAGGHLATVVDGARGMCDAIQLRDFPSFVRTTDRADIMLNFLLREAERLSLPDAVIVNTFEDLEGATLDTMRAILPPIFPVGPLILRERLEVGPASGGGNPLAGLGSSLWKEEEGVLEWLAGRPPRSVVYVNYGSIAVMSAKQLTEFAWGLAGSGYPFLWNVRPDLVKGGGGLPAGFAAAVEGRALLTTWCPQEAVIQHEAVGVFLTHSGWNSTLESLCAGVPMLSWPFFAEQQTNCRYKRTEWGVGMEIGGEVRRDEVAAIIKEAMEGEKGREMRRRAEEWKEMAVEVARSGGPAEANLKKVIDEVLLSKNKGQTVQA